MSGKGMSVEQVGRLAKEGVMPHEASSEAYPASLGPVASETDKSVLGSVVRPNKRALQKNRIVALSPDEKDASAFRILRTQVRRRLELRDAHVLGVCSSRDGEGKSVISINLAMSLAGVASRPVLLVDADLKRPAIAKYMGIKPRKGLDDFLLNEAELGECLVHPGIEGLAILPARKRVSFSSDLLTSHRMTDLMRNLRDVYRDGFVVCDLPPVLLADDYLAFSSHLDACLLVVEDGRSKAGEIQRALSLIGDEKLVGTVLNRAPKSSANYYYGYY